MDEKVGFLVALSTFAATLAAVMALAIGWIRAQKMKGLSPSLQRNLKQSQTLTRRVQNKTSKLSEKIVAIRKSGEIPKDIQTKKFNKEILSLEIDVNSMRHELHDYKHWLSTKAAPNLRDHPAITDDLKAQEDLLRNLSNVVKDFKLLNKRDAKSKRKKKTKKSKDA